MLKGKSENSTYIAAGLKELRRTNTMTQADLSSKSSLTIQSISILERGVGNPVMSNLEKVTNALQTSVPDLISLGKEMEMAKQPTLYKIAAENIRSRRKELNLTQQSLANLANISMPHISLIEKGEQNITLKKLAAIAAALEIHPSQLLIES